MQSSELQTGLRVKCTIGSKIYDAIIIGQAGNSMLDRYTSILIEILDSSFIGHNGHNNIYTLGGGLKLPNKTTDKYWYVSPDLLSINIKSNSKSNTPEQQFISGCLLQTIQGRNVKIESYTNIYDPYKGYKVNTNLGSAWESDFKAYEAPIIDNKGNTGITPDYDVTSETIIKVKPVNTIVKEEVPKSTLIPQVVEETMVLDSMAFIVNMPTLNPNF